VGHDEGSGAAHRIGVGPEDLHPGRARIQAEVDQVHLGLNTPEEGLVTRELGGGIPGTCLTAQLPEDRIADPRHWGKEDRVSNHDTIAKVDG
jgi:hypothetical protein